MAEGRIEKLTKRTVDAAQPRPGRYVVWDSELKGFGLRVEPTGIKTFIVRYRHGGGRRGVLRQFKVGRFGRLTADQARTDAVRLLAEAELGRDPQAKRTADRAVLTVAELCDKYLREGVAAKKESTLVLDRIRIARHIKPLIGSVRITDLTAAQVERMMHDVASGKVRTPESPHARGGRGAASRTVGLLGGIYNFAINEGLCASNPAKAVKRFKDNKRERFLSPKELGALGDVLNKPAMDAAGRRHAQIVKLLALTGARKNEIARLKWSEVDLEGGYLRLEDSKTGPQVLRLGAAALALLSELPRLDEYVFPDPKHRGEPVRGLDWAWVRIRSRAGLGELRIHDLRHSFASVGIASGQALPLIGKLLGHANHASTARYAHLADDPVRVAADRISAVVAGALDRESGVIEPLGQISGGR
jgi:integrase